MEIKSEEKNYSDDYSRFLKMPDSTKGKALIEALRNYLRGPIKDWRKLEETSSYENIIRVVQRDLLDRCDISLLTIETDQEEKWANPLYDALHLRSDKDLRRKIVEFRTGCVNGNQVWGELSKRTKLLAELLLNPNQ